MKISAVYFTESGAKVAKKINKNGFDIEATDGRNGDFKNFVKDNFKTGQSLLFIGAMGIAVRAIAPFANSKATDPAVIVMDDAGNYVIPVLSGHLGGANELAQKLALAMGCTAVITTATDINGVFAIDDWARKTDMNVRNTQHIKLVSSKLLQGKSVGVCLDQANISNLPQGIIIKEPSHVYIGSDVKKGRDKLHLTPKCCVLGVGCRRGIGADDIKKLFEIVCETICDKSFFAVASIDLKRNEAGLLEFCDNVKLPLYTFNSRELSELSEDFTPSEFVKNVTGVDNVCERSARMMTDYIKMRKLSLNGVTMAVGQRVFEADFS